MEKKRMGKKATITTLVVLIACAVLVGALLLNKSDGPVTGMILSDMSIADAEAYSDAAEAQGDGIYLVVSNAFNKFQTDYQSAIPAGSELYANVYFVECPAGSAFTAKLMNDGVPVLEQEGILETGPYGVFSYSLGAEAASVGNYVFELYDGEELLLTQTFTVE
jgi:hypothetical protein